MKTIDQLIQKLQQTERDTASQLEKCKDELSMRIELENKKSREVTRKTKDELTQKLTNTERDLYTTKQQLATIRQNLTKAEKERITLTANTDEALAKLGTKFQTKITEIETAAQKRITELESKLEQKTRQIEQLLSDSKISWYTSINYQASKLISGDQVVPVIVKMSEYTKKKSDKVSFWSDAFYTYHQGYNFYLEINANRNGYMSVSLYLIKGPYDNQLCWPLKGHCEVKLLNQISNSDHYLGSGINQDDGDRVNSYLYAVISRDKSSRHIWCSNQFISHDRLHNITPTCQYLKDDSIFLQVDYKLEH